MHTSTPYLFCHQIKELLQQMNPRRRLCTSALFAGREE